MKSPEKRCRKYMVFILGSHAAGKTTFLQKYTCRLGCKVVLGDSFTPTEEEKCQLIEEWYDHVDGYIVEGQRFFRDAVYRAIETCVDNHDTVGTIVLFTYLTPKEMLRRVKEHRGKEPSAYLKEKAMYEAQTRFRNKFKTWRALKSENVELHEICVDKFSAWRKEVLPKIPYYPKF